jgi:hypothetical protein
VIVNNHISYYAEEYNYLIIKDKRNMYLSAKASKLVSKFATSRLTTGKVLLNKGQASQQLTTLSQQPSMGYFVMNTKLGGNSLLNQSRRMFALPSHIKIEMPNLSPTMEKVRLFDKLYEL